MKSRSESSFSAIFLPRLAREINCGKYSPLKFSVISRISRAMILLLALLSSASAVELYHTNRTFSAIEFNIQGTPTSDQLNQEAKKLTDIVPGAPIKIISTNAFERQIVVGLGYDSGTSAWNAAVGYSAPTRQYPGKMFDNAGWVRGTKSAEGKWGAFIWTMQNQITFKSSETNRWPFGDGKVAITNVIVGSLGNYPPMTSVADTGPDLSRAFNTYPGDNQGDEGEYQVDLTTYYQLAIPEIAVTPKEAVAAVGGSSVRFTATGTNIPSGVTWSINPSGVLSGAVLHSAGYSADVTPGTVPNIYQIRTTSVDCPNLYDEAKLTVCEVESIAPDPIANLQEIEDGDGNPKTRIFVVPIAQALEYPVVPVTVRATLNPNLSESQVPAGWTLQGGNGSEKLTRTVNRSVAAGASKTEFTFSFNGTDSGFKTTIYVYDAKVGLFADNGGDNTPYVGHSWGRYSLDSYAQGLIDEEVRDYLDYIGFWPSIDGGIDCAGDVRLGATAVGSHWPTGSKEYPIIFSTLSSALSTVKASDNSPTWYNLFNNNCTDYAIWIGEIVDKYTMDPSGVSTPWAFSGWLNSN